MFVPVAVLGITLTILALHQLASGTFNFMRYADISVCRQPGLMNYADRMDITKLSCLQSRTCFLGKAKSVYGELTEVAYCGQLVLIL